jgi:hypothetical protein
MRDDAAAEVVKRHRGTDPRFERDAAQPGDIPPVVNPVPQTEPAPIDAPPPNQVVEADESEPETPEGTPAPTERDMLRHRLIAARYRLPL